jgi:hypothetical protein
VIARGGRIIYIGHLADAPLEAALRTARNGGLAAGQARSAGAAAVAGATSHYRLGDRVPDLTVHTIDGGTFRVGATDRTTVLAFLSPWCESYLESSRPQLSADCRAAREASQAHSADPGLRWLGVASGLWASPEDLLGYRDQYRVTIPLTLDESGQLFREFGVMTVPTLVMIDGSGRIVRRVAGAAAGSAAALRMEPVATAEGAAAH